MAYRASFRKSVDPLTPTCKKAAYHSREEAEDMIHHIQENRIVRTLRAYRCSECGMWHLTSKAEK